MAIPVDIPDNTESLHDIGEYVLSYQPAMNAFVDALVNRIAMTLVTSRMWNNPWAPFKRGYIEFGETIEEVFVNIAKPYSYDPDAAAETLFKREIPDVRTAFHSMNWQKVYKVTVSNDQLRTAFLSWGGITDLIARIVDSLYTGMSKDEYLSMKYMLCREALNGGIYPVTTSAIEGAGADPEEAVISFRTYSGLMNFLTDEYNRAGVENSCATENQIIIIPAAIEARISVKVLAAAFNMSEADYLGSRVRADSFTFNDGDMNRLAELFAKDTTYTPFTEGELTTLSHILAMTLDKDYWMCFDNFQQVTQNYNGLGLYWQYFYHAWKTFSVSPFVDAILYTTDANAVTGVTVTPSTVTLAPGSDSTFTAVVAGTGLYSKAVNWSVSGQGKGGTSINALNGLLHVAADETAETLTVKCVSVADSTKFGTSTVTVS